MSFRASLLVAGLLALSPSLASPATCLHLINAGLPPSQNCKKGCRCGNSCISCSKTCRIGASAPIYSPPPAPAPGTAAKPARAKPAPTSSPTYTPRTIPRTPPAAGAEGILNRLMDLPPDVADTTPWVASVRNQLYFRQRCPLAASIPEADRVEQRDSALFAKLGYKRLDVPGC